MDQEKQCPQCGAALAADAPQGLCPACLLKRALDTQSAGGQASAGGSAASSPPTPAEPAPLFPDLEIVELLGQGGMGVVYKARQRHLNRLVALKILSPKIAQDAAFAERFAREARAMALLSHPQIVAVYDSGQTGDMYYFLMEFVDGVNLRQLLTSGKLAPQEALAIVPQICDALQYAHNTGVVHRDIKPENILIDKSGRVKIADFGLAKLMGGETNDFTLTGAGQVMGTPHYMAPEQLEHPLDVDHRADIYSLGVVFYQMLTGELPLGRFDPPSKKVQVDVRLDEVVLRSLEKEPERRYQQVSDVKTELEAIATAAGPVPFMADRRSRERTSRLIEVLQRRLKEYGYTELKSGQIGGVPFVTVLSTSRRRSVRYLCVVAVLPPFVADSEGITRFKEQIRRALTAEYARFPYWKEMGTFTVLLCGSAQYEEFRDAITSLKDRTGLHMNVMLGTCLVDIDQGRSVGEPTWGLYYSGKHYGAILAAISEWGERLDEAAKPVEDLERQSQQASDAIMEAERIASVTESIPSAASRPLSSGMSAVCAWIGLGFFVAGLLSGYPFVREPDSEAGRWFGPSCVCLALVFGIVGRRLIVGKLAAIGAVVIAYFRTAAAAMFAAMFFNSRIEPFLIYVLVLLAFLCTFWIWLVVVEKRRFSLAQICKGICKRILMNDKPIAYVGLFLVLAGFLAMIGFFAFHESVRWLHDSGDAAGWGALAIIAVGCILGLINWSTAPGKVAACFGGILAVSLLAWTATSFGPGRPNDAPGFQEAEPIEPAHPLNSTRHDRSADEELAAALNMPEHNSIAKLTVEYPGAAPQVMQDYVCVPIEQQILGMEGIREITSVSFAGRAEIFVERRNFVDPATSCSQVWNCSQLAVPMLPAAARLRRVADVSSEPIVLPGEAHEIEYPEVHIDRVKAASTGISITAAIEAANKVAQAHQPLTDQTVEGKDGSKVLLRDFATIKWVRGPSHLVRHWPPKNAVPPKKGAARLEFHIVPNPVGSSREPTFPEFAGAKPKFAEQAVKELTEKGPDTADLGGSEFRWFALSGEPAPPDALVGNYRNTTFILLCAGEPYVLLPCADGKEAWALTSARVTASPTDGGRMIEVSLDKRGGELFAALTEANIGNRLAIVVDGKVISAPTIREKISSGIEISGVFTEKEAQALAQRLSAGKSAGAFDVKEWLSGH